MNPNGLGITASGLSAYTASDSGTVIQRYDAASGTWSSFPGRTAPGSTVSVGAVDPTTGIYYFGDVGPTAGGDGHLWGFDTTTNQLVSDTPLVAFPPTVGQNNGDIAFDGGGNLYIVTSSTTDGTLEAISGPLPRTVAEAADLQPIELSTFSVPGNAAVNGIAFDGTGTLYLSQGTTNGVFSIDPGSGSARGTLTPLPGALAGPTGRGLVDLASCAFPPTVSAQKNVVSRGSSSDQFTLEVTGPTVSFPASATTVGSATGLQQTAAGRVLQAGPALARFGDTYTAAETAAGTTDLAQYVSTYSCVDTVNPTNPEFPITGSGSSVSFSLDPFAGEAPSVVCTFTNTVRAPSLTLTKTANPTTVSAAGDTIDHTYTVTNTGNTPLSAIDVNETAFSGAGKPPVPTCPTTPLAPLSSMQCTATYAVTAADVNTAAISNTAVATAQDALAGTITSPDATAVVDVAAAPALTLSKTVDKAAASGPGDIVTYSYLIENTGNTAITDVAVTEGAFSGTGPTPIVTCPAAAASITPGGSVTCTAPYTLTQQDADAGHVDNAATASGFDPAGGTVTSASSSATVTIAPAASLTLDKTADTRTVTAAGQSIRYSFVVTNTGNVTLTRPAIVEGSFSGTGGPVTVSCPVQTTLASGATMTCTADYRTTDADIASGRISNTATASGTDPLGATIESAASDAVVDAAAEVAPPR